MKTILVEPVILEGSASQIEGIVTQYQETFRRLYQAVDTMSLGWQGADNVAFVTQIQGYQDDFQKIAMLLMHYSEFLRTSARAYRDTQAELAAQAMRLSN